MKKVIKKKPGLNELKLSSLNKRQLNQVTGGIDVRTPPVFDENLPSGNYTGPSDYPGGTDGYGYELIIPKLITPNQTSDSSGEYSDLS